MKVLRTAMQKLQSIRKESWTLFRLQWAKATFLHYNYWFKKLANAHDLKKQFSLKTRSKDNTKSVVRAKFVSKKNAANTHIKGTHRPASTISTISSSTRWFVWESKHRIRDCGVFEEKSSTQQSNVIAEAKLCFTWYGINI